MASRSMTRIPIALPTVRIQVDHAGALAVTVDKEPYDPTHPLHRDQMRQLLENLTSDLGPIRVEITESNGERYVDIATPGEDNHAPPEPMSSPPEAPHVTAQFQAGEDVMIAVAVARRTAEPDGKVTLHLPPSFVQRYGDDLVLIGQTSRASATFTDLLRKEPT